MMASSDIPYRLIQLNRRSMIFINREAEPTGYLPRLSSSLSQEPSSEADDDGVKSLLSRACDFLRLRFSRSASFSRSCRRSLGAFPLRASLSFPPSIIVNLLTVPPIVLVPSCPIKAPARRFLHPALPACRTAGLLVRRIGPSRACALPSLVARIAPLCGAIYERFFDLASRFRAHAAVAQW